MERLGARWQEAGWQDPIGWGRSLEFILMAVEAFAEFSEELGLLEFCFYEAHLEVGWGPSDWGSSEAMA